MSAARTRQNPKTPAPARRLLQSVGFWGGGSKFQFTRGSVCALLVAILPGIADRAAGDSAEAPRASINIPLPPGGDAAAPIVGAYYYPWYGVGGQDVESDWRHVFRRRLKPLQRPALSWYRSDDPVVVAEHLRQSRRAGLSFWAVSWWGPQSATDRVFRDVLMPHADAQDFRFALLYESTGRLGDLDRPRHDNWTSDVSYMAERYFSHPSYLRINGRPVLLVYLSRVYFRDRGQAALAAMRRRFPEIYLVGDDVFGPGYRAEWAKPFDAVTIYDVYGQSAGIHGSTRKAIDALAANYVAARQAANAVGVGFIPTVAPGYNDSAVRAGHDGAPRYFVDQPQSNEGDLFRQMIRDAALPQLDDRAGRLMLVTSFNEWYEDTQIEPTSAEALATSFDDSPSGQALTLGRRYADYGTLYLDILREETASAADRVEGPSPAPTNAR